MTPKRRRSSRMRTLNRRAFGNTRHYFENFSAATEIHSIHKAVEAAKKGGVLAAIPALLARLASRKKLVKRPSRGA